MGVDGLPSLDEVFGLFSCGLVGGFVPCPRFSCPGIVESFRADFLPAAEEGEGYSGADCDQTGTSLTGPSIEDELLFGSSCMGLIF